ncbi:response regulator transcription factor, partial [Sphingopyxis bauzanensis]|uniref:response regulator transcription factor n=1 Tax=Sphingopyxis bauzanensis TaxID=651663 RepID=UPI001181BC14
DVYKRQGLDCVAYDGALAFLSDLPHRRFACLVTDIRMPGMNGLELIERLHSAGSTLPVVVLTSVRDARMRDRALALGTFDWLMKPVTDHRLLQVLGSAIGTDAVSYTHLDVYKRQSLQRSRR